MDNCFDRDRFSCFEQGFHVDFGWFQRLVDEFSVEPVDFGVGIVFSAPLLKKDFSG